MVRLALHWPNPSIQEEQPIVDFVRFPRAFREAYEMFRIVLLDEILHDRAGFEKSDGLAILKAVSQSWNPTIWVDFEKPWLLLGVFNNINLVYLVG